VDDREAVEGARGAEFDLFDLLVVVNEFDRRELGWLARHACGDKHHAAGGVTERGFRSLDDLQKVSPVRVELATATGSIETKAVVVIGFLLGIL